MNNSAIAVYICSKKKKNCIKTERRIVLKKIYGTNDNPFTELKIHLRNCIRRRRILKIAGRQKMQN